jgi:hypothetical protein
MSLLFENAQSTEASFTIKADSDYCGSDVVLVGRHLWASLASDNLSHRVALSISTPSYGQQRLTGQTKSCPALICWSVQDEEVCHAVFCF